MNDEPTSEILNATYRALCKHGYAELTLQCIAAESEMSKAAIHYYYESKNELFVAFLDFLYDRYTTQIDSTARDSPREHLRSLLEVLLTTDEDTPGTEFRTAMLEVKAQAPYDDEIQDRLVEFGDYLFERIREIIAAGIDAGEFDESVAPSRIAEVFTTIIVGSHTRQVAVDYSTDRLGETITSYIETHLLISTAVEGTQ
ncbi:TetR/AcrR family transcriptional regulator [Natrinema soli]|uniref:TetR/AcrR family transcriptional regulator n=1 Tax=Natrinema soli TaxID=1930624 RepID=A0ABD5SRL3_9EURY|nr:TetR/AcrR family transcriptional regulator [Natrinema soli]